MKKVCLSLMIGLLAGCVSSPPELSAGESAIQIFSTAPNCKFRNLGYVSASSGSVAWDVEGNSDISIAELKKRAFEKGANAILLKSSAAGDRAWHSSGVVHEAAGDAIVIPPDCQP